MNTPIKYPLYIRSLILSRRAMALIYRLSREEFISLPSNELDTVKAHYLINQAKEAFKEAKRLTEVINTEIAFLQDETDRLSQEQGE